MNDPRSTTPPVHHRYRRHRITLSEGGQLVLHRDGSIDHVGADGGVIESWDVVNPEWSRHALRFGITPGAITVAPRRRDGAVGKIRP